MLISNSFSIGEAVFCPNSCMVLIIKAKEVVLKNGHFYSLSNSDVI